MTVPSKEIDYDPEIMTYGEAKLFAAYAAVINMMRERDVSVRVAREDTYLSPHERVERQLLRHPRARHFRRDI